MIKTKKEQAFIKGNMFIPHKCTNNGKHSTIQKPR